MARAAKDQETKAKCEVCGVTPAFWDSWTRTYLCEEDLQKEKMKRDRDEDSEQPGGYGLEEVEGILRDAPFIEDAAEQPEKGSFEGGGGESGGAGSSGEVAETPDEGGASGDE